MSDAALTAVIVIGVALVLITYWLIAVTEGAYLGARGVRWLYDRGASTYDDVKGFRRPDEVSSLGNPLVNRLEPAFGPRALVLDVATGTARLPIALFDLPFYEGQIVGVDISRGMLEQAVAKTRPWSERIHLVEHPAAPLPFRDASFDGVTLLEALEFLPDRAAALRELVRVLRPGGWLLVTNRIGWDATLMPGKVDGREAFERRLAALGLADVETKAWQSYYDLVWARQPGKAAVREAEPPWFDALVCPGCGQTDRWRDRGDDRLSCQACDRVLRADGGIWSVSTRG